MPAPPLSSLTRTSSTLRDLFIYLYDLSPLDIDLLFLLIKTERPMSLEELVKEADRDKSTVFRSLQKLVSLGICIKETRTVKEGGYYHVYSAIDMKTFRITTEQKVKELEATFHRLLRKFEDSIQDIVESIYRDRLNSNININNSDNNNKRRSNA
jgi:predicted transcriptional regulator